MSCRSLSLHRTKALCEHYCHGCSGSSVWQWSTRSFPYCVILICCVTFVNHTSAIFHSTKRAELEIVVAALALPLLKVLPITVSTTVGMTFCSKKAGTTCLRKNLGANFLKPKIIHMVMLDSYVFAWPCCCCKLFTNLLLSCPLQDNFSSAFVIKNSVVFFSL